MIAFAACICLCQTARADDSLHAIVTVTSGFTDNVLGARADDPEVDAEADGFMLLSPGIVYSQETRRFAQVATYTFGASMYMRHSEANAYDHEGTWAGIWALSRESEVGGELSLTQGQINSFRATTPADRTELGLEPARGGSFLALSAAQLYNRRFGRDWRFNQRASFRLFQNLDNPLISDANYYSGGSLGLRRRFDRTALAASVRANYIVNAGRMPTGADESTVQEQFLLGSDLQLIRDVGKDWNVAIGAGLQSVTPADTFEPWLTLPTGMAALRYITEVGDAELAYRRTVQPNLFVGETTANDVVSLRGGVPLPWNDDVGVSGSAGYSRGEILDVRNGDRIGSIDLLIFDAALHWEIEREIELSLRAQRFRQVRDEMAPGTLEDLSRTQVFVAISGRYPRRQATTIPTRDAVRVDDSDRMRIGESRRGGSEGGE